MTAGVALSFFHLPQKSYAAYVAGVFLFLTVISFDLSFLVLLFVTQFFIGDFYRPYQWLLDVFVLIFCVAWLIYAGIRRKKVSLSAWWLVLPYFLVLALAVPLNLKEVVLDAKVLGISRFLSLVGNSGTLYREYWLRELSWGFLSLFLFFVLTNYLPGKGKAIFKAGLILGAALVMASIYGILHAYKLLPVEGTFLSINFSDTRHNPGMLTSFGWSVSFFAEYFAATFPFVFISVCRKHKKGEKWKRIGAVLLSVLVIFAALKTYRRAVFLILPFELIIGSIFCLKAIREVSNPWNWKGKKRWLILWAVISLGTLCVLFLLVFGSHNVELRNNIARKFSIRTLRKDPRIATHLLCLHMATHEPLMGLGPGGYSQQFDRFGGSVTMCKYEKYLGFGRWLNDYQGSPHSTYLKMLAERGVLGLLAFLWLAGGAVFFGWKAFQSEPPGKEKLFLGTVLTCLGGMLIYGFFMDFFWLPATRVLFWVYLAFVVALAEPVIPKIPFTKKKAVVIGMVFLALLGYRLYRVKAEPISDHYEAGFYRWQVPRKGSDRRPYRLTSGHALKVFTVKKDTIRFRVCSNKPDVEKSPQVVTVYLNGKTVKKIELRDKGWHEVVIPAQLLKGKKVFLDIQVDGTWVPYRYGRGRSKRELGVIVGRIKG